MSTAFITGRNEGSRGVTESNLKKVGLGEKCAENEKGNIIRTEDKPCYVALHLRDLKSTLNSGVCVAVTIIILSVHHLSSPHTHTHTQTRVGRGLGRCCLGVPSPPGPVTASLRVCVGQCALRSATVARRRAKGAGVGPAGGLGLVVAGPPCWGVQVARVHIRNG